MPCTISQCCGSQRMDLTHSGRTTVSHYSSHSSPPSSPSSPHPYPPTNHGHSPPWDSNGTTRPRLTDPWPAFLGPELTPPPFLIGVNTRQKYHHRHRQLYTAGTRSFTHHDFTASYSLKHRSFANDNITCVCGRAFTREHALTQCPIHSTPRRRPFGNYAHMNFIFGTEASGRAFARFVDETGVFLKPLPLRPDPP